MLAPHLFRIVFVAVIFAAFHTFKVVKDDLDARVGLWIKTGAEGWAETRTGEPAPVTPLWCMKYTDGATIISLCPE